MGKKRKDPKNRVDKLTGISQGTWQANAKGASWSIADYKDNNETSGLMKVSKYEKAKSGEYYIKEVKVYIDTNSNRKIDKQDALLGSAATVEPWALDNIRPGKDYPLTWDRNSGAFSLFTDSQTAAAIGYF